MFSVRLVRCKWFKAVKAKWRHLLCFAFAATKGSEGEGEYTGIQAPENIQNILLNLKEENWAFEEQNMNSAN